MGEICRPKEEPMIIVSRDGTPIADWRSGHGPPLVLVHGTSAGEDPLDSPRCGHSLNRHGHEPSAVKLDQVILVCRTCGRYCARTLGRHKA